MAFTRCCFFFCLQKTSYGTTIPVHCYGKRPGSLLDGIQIVDTVSALKYIKILLTGSKENFNNNKKINKQIKLRVLLFGKNMDQNGFRYQIIHVCKFISFVW